jgi:hypothetical protein
MRIVSFTVATFLSWAAFADAALISFDTSQSPFTAGVKNQGWWSDTRENFDTNENYFTGDSGGSPGGASRSFFTFDLASLDLTGKTVSSATLELARFFYVSDDPAETIGFFDVSTPAATLNNNVGTSATIFDDLGSGAGYGNFVVPDYTFSVNFTLTFALNDVALADIASAAGGFFSIGGRLQTLDDVEGLFAGSHLLGVQRLTLDIRPLSAPEPNGLLLLGAGLATTIAVTTRKQKRAGTT